MFKSHNYTVPSLVHLASIQRRNKIDSHETENWALDLINNQVYLPTAYRENT